MNLQEMARWSARECCVSVMERVLPLLPRNSANDIMLVQEEGRVYLILLNMV